MGLDFGVFGLGYSTLAGSVELEPQHAQGARNGVHDHILAFLLSEDILIIYNCIYYNRVFNYIWFPLITKQKDMKAHA